MPWTAPYVPGQEPETLLAALESTREELRVTDEEVRAQQETIRRLTESHKSLRLQQERTISILPVPVVVTDMRGIVTSVNAAAAALVEMRVAHLLGKPLFNLFEVEDRVELRRLLAGQSRGATEGLVVRGTATLVARRGGPLVVDLAGSLELPGPPDAEVAWVLLPRAGHGQTTVHITESLAALAVLTRRRDDTPALLTSAANICATALDTDVSVSLGPPAAPEQVASSSQLAQAYDGAQLLAGEGPSASAYETGVTVSTRSLATETRWPALSGHLPVGVRAVVATPVRCLDQVVGTLTAYAAPDESVSEETIELLAVTLGGVLHELELLGELTRLEDDMERALVSRAVIDQAKGILMSTHGIDADAAWARLVHLSSTQHEKVRDVAEHLVAQARDRGGQSHE